ncbi:TetR/AcrR family transcriptional regulator [Oscillospiraceae bacterium LTW-04]|nr:TetR/AcrR family transcriptional regulator [Oscillospiraceae bacterium MB24-C1]
MKKRVAQTLQTKEKLTDAFWMLYEQKPYDQITVREITDLAGFNRSTFYTYFKDVYDVLEQTEEEIFRMFAKGYETEGYVIDENQLKESINFWSDYFEKNHTRLALLLGEKGDAKFAYRILDQMREKMRDSLREICDLSDKKFDYVVEYMLHAHIGLTLTWFKNGCDIPFQSIVELKNDLMIGGIFSAIACDTTSFDEKLSNYIKQFEKFSENYLIKTKGVRNE